MNQLAREAVSRGANALDQFFTYRGETEDWLNYIDRQDFDMGFSHLCVMGQLASVMVTPDIERGWRPSYSDGWKALTDKVTLSEPVEDFRPRFSCDCEECLPDWNQSAWHGFYDADGYYTYEELNEAWLNEFRERDRERTTQN